MSSASERTKLNYDNISVVSLGGDSFQRQTAEEVKETAQPGGDSLSDHQNPNPNNQTQHEHVKAFYLIFNTFYKFAGILGIVVSYSWKPFKHIMFFCILFQLTFVWLCILYTQAMHIKNGNPIRVLEACGIYGTTSSSVQKLLGYMSHRDQIVTLFYCMRKICLQTIPGRRADIIHRDLTKTKQFLTLFPVGVLSCVGLFFLCPMKAYIEDKEFVPLLPIEIFFVDQSNLKGFIKANVIMAVLGSFAALGLVLYGSVFIFAIFMYSLKVHLIEEDLKELDEMWSDNVKVPLAYRHSYLKNICLKRQDLNRFMTEIKNIFGMKLFVYFVFNYFSQIICLFEVTKSGWTPGYAIALVSFTEMMFYCVMGTKITIADERLFTSIYTTNWYTYDLYSQKLIILLLHYSETPNELRLGPIGPLNVVTGIAVVKSIYSYYTIITELL